MSQLKIEITAGAKTLGLDLPELQIEQLVRYLELLDKWNKAYNLSAIRDIHEMVSMHILDSLAVLPHLNANHIIDVGTGGGIPGLILAITCPDKKFTLLDSNGKKIRFCQQSAFELKLENVTCIQARSETYQPDEKFECVISRAFTAMDNMLDCCSHLLRKDGYLLAMKGPGVRDELLAIEKRISGSEIIPLCVPGVEQARNLLKVNTRS